MDHYLKMGEHTPQKVDFLSSVMSAGASKEKLTDIHLTKIDGSGD